MRKHALKRVVNLCFHGIDKPRRILEEGEQRYWITLERFEEILCIAANEPSVRISFDDGNESDVSLALPRLIDHGLTAHFFVVAGRLGSQGCVKASEIRVLADRGMAIGLHGMNHRSWRSLRDDELHEELTEASAIIADSVGRPVRTAAFPLGSYDRNVLRALRARGFTRVYTVDGGSANPNAWLQTRYTVTQFDDASSIQTLIRRPDGSPIQRLRRSTRSFVKRRR